VKASGKGPLFYNEPRELAAPNDPTNPRKPRYVKAREHVAAWVRGLGVNDPELSPNYAWRHTASVRLRTRLKSFAKFPQYKCAGKERRAT